MENNSEKTTSDNKLTLEIEKQEELVRNLEKEMEEEPNDELKMKIQREKDFLRHLRHFQKSNSKERAENTAKKAAKAALSRLIHPVEE